MLQSSIFTRKALMIYVIVGLTIVVIGGLFIYQKPQWWTTRFTPVIILQQDTDYVDAATKTVNYQLLPQYDTTWEPTVGLFTADQSKQLATLRSLADLYRQAPFLKTTTAFVPLHAELVNHLSRGNAYEVITDPTAFAEAYRREYEAENPNEPFVAGKRQLRNYGLPDFSVLSTPTQTATGLTFFAVNRSLGFPYQVTYDYVTDPVYEPIAVTAADEGIIEETTSEEVTGIAVKTESDFGRITGITYRVGQLRPYATFDDTKIIPLQVEFVGPPEVKNYYTSESHELAHTVESPGRQQTVELFTLDDIYVSFPFLKESALGNDAALFHAKLVTALDGNNFTLIETAPDQATIDGWYAQYEKDKAEAYKQWNMDPESRSLVQPGGAGDVDWESRRAPDYNQVTAPTQKNGVLFYFVQHQAKEVWQPQKATYAPGTFPQYRSEW